MFAWFGFSCYCIFQFFSKTYFIFMLYIFSCVKILCIMHSTAKGHLDCFQFLAITKRAAVNILHVSFTEHMHIFLLAIYLSVQLLSFKVCICSAFIDISKQSLKSCSNFNTHWQYGSIVGTHFFQNLEYFLFFFIVAVLVFL